MTGTHNKKTPFLSRFVIAAAVGVATAGVASSSNAQQSQGVLVDVDDCVQLPTREQQLACYGERVNAALSAQEPVDSNSEPESTAENDAAPAPEQSNRSRRAERREAREAEELQREVEKRQRAAAEAVAALENINYTAGEIVAEITALREMEPDAYLITLDNGQVWRQNQPKRYPLSVGTEVRIRPGNWGPSYRLTDPKVGNFIQVRRAN